MTPSRYQELLQAELDKKTNYNKDLIEERNNLTQQQLGLGAQLRSEWADQKLDPLMRENLIAQRRGQVGGRLGTVTDLLGARGQYFSDILNKATNAYAQEQADAERARAEAARRSAAAQQAAYYQQMLDAQKQQDEVVAPAEDVVGSGVDDIEIYVPTKPRDKTPVFTKAQQDYNALSKYGSGSDFVNRLTVGLANVPDFFEGLFTKRKFK